MGLSYFVLIYSLFILHTICATELIQHKDESNLEIMKKKDANEGIRRDTEVITEKSPTTVESMKVRKDIEKESELNLENDTDDDVRHPPPLRTTGGPKTAKDEHAHFPPENEFKEEHEKDDQEPQKEHTTTKVPPNCTEVKATGPCRASIPRFYFNTISRKCESFTYGGCKGNGNNYITKEECEDNCINRKSDASSNST